jgi:hypothetical protein
MKGLLLGSLAAMLAATTAYAGARIVRPVTINLSQKSAQGSIADTRNDGSNLSYVVLVVGVSTTSVPSESASVWMRDASGLTVSCYTTNPDFVSAIGSASNDAFITMYWDANNNCTGLDIYNDSRFAPKAP